MDQALRDKGLANRKAVLGEEYVTRSMASADAFNAPFQDILNEYCWGMVWGDERLPRKTRSMLNLAMLATLLRPSSGAIRYGDLQAADAPPELRARIGVLGHDLFLYPELTARENLAFFAALYGSRDADGSARAALSQAGLTDRGDDLVGGFSRGMRQRVALERALIHDPRLALLDEPFTGLDEASTSALVARLRGLRERGTAIVLATHDLDIAEGLLDEAVFLREGRMVESVSRPDGLRSTYRRVMTGPGRS